MTYSILLDTNILIDAIVSDRPQHAEAKRVFAMAARGTLRVAVAASSLKDVYYVMRKRDDDGRARELVRLCLRLFDVLPVDRTACELALASDEPDFEDGIIRAVAEAERVSFIVTRDAAAYANAAVRAVDARTLLGIIDARQS